MDQQQQDPTQQQAQAPAQAAAPAQSSAPAQDGMIGKEMGSLESQYGLPDNNAVNEKIIQGAAGIFEKETGFNIPAQYEK